jgi:hypothetical protein
MAKVTKAECAECKWVPGRSSEIDKKSYARAEEFLRGAFREFMQGTRTLPERCFPCCANIVIRRIAGLLYEQAVAYGLDADLKITLDLISQGLEDKIPGELCEVWASRESDLDFEPWMKKGEV